ncbi:MAG: hypothetical protein E7411_08125 [Ruminococcaceae bacterium]|nr:hypothetical protein [Oscillospiraceae bacterium]
MKKLLALLLMAVLTLTLLTGCSDPVYDDLSNFLNVQMVEVNADYEKLKTEIANVDAAPDDAALKVAIDTKVLPLIKGSLEKLSAITVETEEVKAVKDKYVKVMETYKEGFEALSKGCETQAEETITAGTNAINKAIELLDEYNKALEELAKEHGGEIEY